MLTACFSRPEANEAIKVGRMLKTLHYELKEVNQGTVYYIVPIASAA